MNRTRSRIRRISCLRTRRSTGYCIRRSLWTTGSAAPRSTVRISGAWRPWRKQGRSVRSWSRTCHASAETIWKRDSTWRSSIRRSEYGSLPFRRMWTRPAIPERSSCRFPIYSTNGTHPRPARKSVPSGRPKQLPAGASERSLRMDT